MQIAYSKTREQFPLSPKKIIKKTILMTIRVIGLFILLGILALPIIIIRTNLTSPEMISWLGTATFWILGFLLLVILLTYLYQRWYFAVYFYDLTPDFIKIKKGPITPREIIIPYERIQDVYVDQDFFDRILGLYDVHLSSATISSGIEAHIDGVEKQAAEGLRNVILQTIQQKVNKNTNISTSDNPTS